MLIKQIEAGPIGTNCYLIHEGAGSEAVLIDAPTEAAFLMMPFIEENNIRLRAVFLTHSHWDHTMDAPEFRRKTGAAVYIHKDDEHRLLKPMEYTSIPVPFEIEPFSADKYYKQGDILKTGNFTFEVRHTPGHSEGGVALVEHVHKSVFCGDTLFNEGVGRVDLPGGNWDTLVSSIKNKLLTLPDDYKVYSGHGPTTSIGHEKKSNPFLLNI